MNKCNVCQSELIAANVNGRPTLVCENCLRKQGHIINIDMTKCTLCETWYNVVSEKMCSCQKLGET